MKLAQTRLPRYWKKASTTSESAVPGLPVLIYKTGRAADRTAESLP